MKTIKTNIPSLNKKITHYDVIRTPPSIGTSYASYVLMKESYRAKDVDYIEHKKIIEQLKVNSVGLWLSMKRKVFTINRKHYGKLTCVICQRDDLKIPEKNLPKLEDFHATMEHIDPVSGGGLRYSIKNLTCTCNKCNDDRGILPMFKVGEHRYKY